MGTAVERLSSVIESVATDQFYRQFLSYLKHFFIFEHAVVYVFEHGTMPRCLMTTADFKESAALHHLYQQGAYLQDPFYQALDVGFQQTQSVHSAHQPAPRETQILTLKKLTTHNFQHSDYYQHFFQKTGWRDETVLFLHLAGHRKLAVSFGSSHQAVHLHPRYSSTEMYTALNLLKSVVGLHISLASNQPISLTNHTLSHHVPPAYQRLTPREREIVNLILAGVRSPQIAEQLFISVGTVKNHRKNIYFKLQISSQAELFNCFAALPQSTSSLVINHTI